jgi:hypothetical protein
METWFLLFSGQSADGNGQPKYIGRTLDKKIALKHYKQCKKNPYSTGCVKIVTDTSYITATDTDWSK